MKEATLIALLTCHRLCHKFLINELAAYVAAWPAEVGMHFPAKLLAEAQLHCVGRLRVCDIAGLSKSSDCVTVAICIGH